MLNLPIFLDNNSTTRVDDKVLETMLPYFSNHYGNAASKSHSLGWEASEAVNYAREQIALLIGSEPNEIIFTSGATESDNLALKGVFEKYASKGNHIITVAIEHKAVLDTCAHIENLGGEVSYLKVDSDGLISLSELENSIQPNTILISVMYANNETGVIQPIKEISAIAKKHGIIFFSDATQAIGKIPVNVIEDGIDLMAFSAHKIYGPKGIGALYIRRKNPRVTLTQQMDGGGHEKGFRSGTLNVPGIVGFGKACEISRLQMIKESKRIRQLRDYFENELLSLPDIKLNGSSLYRNPNTSNLSFKNKQGPNLLSTLSKNIAVSSGSACTSANLAPSHVLKAMGLEDELALSSIRFSLGRFTTQEEIDYTISSITNFSQNFAL
ncbi:MAG: IscS subfamily cysteine desulfurase [Ginsengibacter sp.]|jgi:cysteine desulfurase